MLWANAPALPAVDWLKLEIGLVKSTFSCVNVCSPDTWYCNLKKSLGHESCDHLKRCGRLGGPTDFLGSELHWLLRRALQIQHALQVTVAILNCLNWSLVDGHLALDKLVEGDCLILILTLPRLMRLHRRDLPRSNLLVACLEHQLLNWRMTQ